MPSEALQRPARQPVRVAISTTPPRLRPKGPLGPDFPRQLQAAAGRPKQSAVERLEADKAKYVKSQVALSKQLPVRVPDARKPPPPQFNPNAALRPTRKSPAPLKARRVELNLLNNLANLISDVNDDPQQPSAAAESQEEAAKAGGAPAGEQQQQQQQEKKKEKPRPPPPPPRPNWSSLAKVRSKASGPAGEDSPPASPVSPTARTVRRVDVMPAAGTPRRAPVTIRQPLHPVWLQQPHFPLRQAASRFHQQHPSKTAGAPPLKPVAAPRKPAVSAGAETPTAPAAPPPPAPAPSPPAAPLPLFPPPSPARTRLSSSSTRKRPSLTRSKSDMSDRCSRVGTELERFFNLCGLDPTDLQEWAGSCSDIVSMARFRSVSAPGSECAGSDREGEEEEEEEEVVGDPTGRVPYGLSVIERNARVIKWLYGLRNAKDSANKSTDL